ncbi:hypothetical protein DFH28DRAFT_930350 [Melampsora americana]|nr:hypothetical protein DFH28DRAFT_930350 [Melampsora americana]
MSAGPRRSQPAYISSAFEITAPGPGSQSSQSGYSTVTSGLNCTGIDGASPFEHPILLSSYASAGTGLSVGEIYVLKAKLLAANAPRIPHAIHEQSHHIHAGSAETFPGNLINNVAISSIGVITDRRTVQEAAHGGKPTTVSIIRHTDWDPMAGDNVEFHIEYWCRPVRNLAKVLNLFQKGREVTINGFITGNDRERHILQVDVYSVSVATGHENVNTPTTFAGTAQTRTTKAGRVRLPRLDFPAVHTRNAATSLPSPTPLSSQSPGTSQQSEVKPPAKRTRGA